MYNIEVRNLTKSFGYGKNKVLAVDNLSFSIKRGEIFGLLGVNGAGKTTTINMLTGLLTQDKGSIKILGLDPEKNWEKVKNSMNVGNAFFPLSDLLTIRQNLKVYAMIYNIKDSKAKIGSLLSMFGLVDIQHRRISNLSSGELTRAILCKALINDPKILFLDECTVGLDPDIADRTRKIILDFHKRTNCTIIFTSHYMAEVEELCDRIAIMDKGRIIKVLDSSELYRALKNYTVEIVVRKNLPSFIRFLKKEGLNIVSAEKNRIVFEVTWEQDKIFKILSKIFAAGFILDDLHINRPDLEQVFISIARGKGTDLLK